MSLPDDAELVRQCAREGSQSAFAILVERHAPLVHSVARRLTGDTDLARDVTQRVFLDLLNKVSQVWELIEKQRSSGPAVLSGWLHRASRYEALELTRSERRRQARERQAMELLMQDSGEDPFWETVRPVVDEALDSLPEPDRRALLLRYFQGAGFREIGAALELSDDAAQKRVSRSLERLREQFAARGITTTAAALGVALAAHAVEPVPIGLADQIAAAVWTAPRSGLVGSSKMASAPQDSASTNAFSASLPVAAGLAVIALLGALLWLARRDGPATPVPESGSMVEEVAATPAVENAPGVAPSGATNEEQQLQLLVRSADSRAPVTNVLVVPYFTTERTQLLPTQFSDAFGRAEVTYPTNASVLTIDLRLEGYADTRLSWNRTRGLTIPAVQEVRLIRAPRIGGLVVNIAGVPLTNTMVQLHLPDGRPEIAQVESHTCELQIVTDSEGRWSTARVAEELFSRFEGTPWRKDHLSHGWTRFANQPEAIGQLLAGTYVFTLDTGLSFRGRVVDEFDAPVSGAVVLLGDYLSNQHSAQTTNNGEFVLGGALPGNQIITALEKTGQTRGVTFQTIKVSDATPFVTLRLEPFRTLHVQTVDPDGNPVGEVKVIWEYQGLSTGAFDFDGTRRPLTPQFSFDEDTDNQGELTWTQAPADTVFLSFQPKDHAQRHHVLLTADGTLQTVVLEPTPPAQVIRGIVRDAVTGEPVDGFRVRDGYPSQLTDGRIMPDWDENSSMHAHDFHGGRFELKFRNGSQEDQSRYRRILHISAPGYESGITRPVNGDEGDVELEVSLRRVPPGGVKLGYWSQTGDQNAVFVLLQEVEVPAGATAEVEHVMPSKKGP